MPSIQLRCIHLVSQFEWQMVKWQMVEWMTYENLVDLVFKWRVSCFLHPVQVVVVVLQVVVAHVLAFFVLDVGRALKLQAIARQKVR